MTPDELKRYFPQASQSTLRANQARRSASSAKPQQAVRHEPVAEKGREGSNPSQVHVRIKSFRRRLTDPDNLCPKYFIDCLRYAGIIADDSQEHISLEVSQAKVKSPEDERTEIELTQIEELKKK